MTRFTYFVMISLLSLAGKAQSQVDSIPGVEISDTAKNLVYVFDIKREIGSTSWIHTQKSFEEAYKLNAGAIIIHMNTYGGQVIFADSIRTKILNSKIPVYVFIDNNAASAGALISIACDSIFMRMGANIGAATVVNQSGEEMPDKYQSYMRSTIRSTAESQGKRTVIDENGDTSEVWVRDPNIAQAMVDESIHIEGVIDSGKVLTFTTLEALEYGFCDGTAENIDEVIEKIGIKNYELVRYEPTTYDYIKGFVTSPVLRGILILLIIGGIYFELQSPGIGFPLAISVLAAIMYFAPLYIDGLAQNWEIILFIVGVILVALEIFVIPGFGIAGISGIILMVAGLTLSMVDNVVFETGEFDLTPVFTALLTVLISVFLGLFISFYLTKKFVSAEGPMRNITLMSTQNISDGYISVDSSLHGLKGKTGVAHTVLRLSGKVIIDDKLYDAKSEYEMIERGEPIKVVRAESGQVYVVKLKEPKNE